MGYDKAMQAAGAEILATVKDMCIKNGLYNEVKEEVLLTANSDE